MSVESLKAVYADNARLRRDLDRYRELVEDLRDALVIAEAYVPRGDHVDRDIVTEAIRLAQPVQARDNEEES